MHAINLVIKLLEIIFFNPPQLKNECKGGLNLDLRQDGHNRGCDAEEHVDADEDLVLSATIRVGVEDVKHDQRHQRQQIVDCSD